VTESWRETENETDDVLENPTDCGEVRAGIKCVCMTSVGSGVNSWLSEVQCHAVVGGAVALAVPSPLFWPPPPLGK